MWWTIRRCQSHAIATLRLSLNGDDVCNQPSKKLDCLSTGGLMNAEPPTVAKSRMNSVPWSCRCINRVFLLFTQHKVEANRKGGLFITRTKQFITCLGNRVTMLCIRCKLRGRSKSRSLDAIQQATVFIAFEVERDITRDQFTVSRTADSGNLTVANHIRIKPLACAESIASLKDRAFYYEPELNKPRREQNAAIR